MSTDINLLPNLEATASSWIHIIPRAFRSDSIGDSQFERDLIPWRGEDSRHASDGYDQNGLFGFGASASCGRFERRQPKPASVVFGGGSRWDGASGRCAHWRHGPSDAARLGSSLQRSRSGRTQRYSLQGPAAAAIAGTVGRLCRDRRDWAGSAKRRRGPLAADRLETRD